MYPIQFFLTIRQHRVLQKFRLEMVKSSIFTGAHGKTQSKHSFRKIYVPKETQPASNTETRKKTKVKRDEIK